MIFTATFAPSLLEVGRLPDLAEGATPEEALQTVSAEVLRIRHRSVTREQCYKVALVVRPSLDDERAPEAEALPSWPRSEFTSSSAAASRASISALQPSAKRDGSGSQVGSATVPTAASSSAPKATRTRSRSSSSWANHGPSAARVDGVDIRWRGYTGEFPEFSIEST